MLYLAHFECCPDEMCIWIKRKSVFIVKLVPCSFSKLSLPLLSLSLLQSNSEHVHCLIRICWMLYCGWEARLKFRLVQNKMCVCVHVQVRASKPPRAMWNVKWAMLLQCDRAIFVVVVMFHFKQMYIFKHLDEVCIGWSFRAMYRLKKDTHKIKLLGHFACYKLTSSSSSLVSLCKIRCDEYR